MKDRLLVLNSALLHKMKNVVFVMLRSEDLSGW